MILKEFYLLMIIVVFLLLMFLTNNLQAAKYGATGFLGNDDTSKTKTIMVKDPDMTPLQRLQGATFTTDSSSLYSKDQGPGGMPKTGYSSEQDSAYLKAMRVKVPIATRLNAQLKMYALNYNFAETLEDRYDVAKRNMMVPSSMYQADPREVYMHQYNLAMSQYVPFVQTMARPGVGAQVPFSTIGKFFGIIEDVSPEIKYDIEFPTDVEVVVYSMQATVVATMYKGFQAPGPYSLTWNGRNDKGKLMPKGDYIGEVRIGNFKYIRKRIYIP